MGKKKFENFLNEIEKFYKKNEEWRMFERKRLAEGVYDQTKKDLVWKD